MKNYLLVPVMPTPNGPLHLGHIAGPFLRMDVLARSLRQAGHQVSIVSASDPWETHVLLRALTTDTPPDRLCHRYHREIADGLAALNIRYDQFIDVLDAPWRNALPNVANNVLAALARQDALRVVKENVPYSVKYQMPVAGALIEGTCPKCRASMGGFFCERCGAETSPGKLVEPRSRLPDDVWEWRSYDSLYLEVRDVAALRAAAEQICADHTLVGMAFDGLALNDNLIRLTHPGTWGIPARAAGVSADSVIFTYPALLALSLLCTGATGDETVDAPAAGTAFAPSSETITIKSFGIDNSMPYLVSVLAQTLATGSVKPFDHYLTNYFGTLDGKKFSTSRNHAIWALDAQRLLNANVDTIRAYLSVVNPQHGETDFSIAEFGAFRTEWEARLEQNVTAALASRASREPGTQAGDIERLAQALKTRDAALDPARFALADATQPIRDWMRLADDGRATRAWALGLAVLAWPVMPDLSERIWRDEGLPGLPAFDALAARLHG